MEKLKKTAKGLDIFVSIIGGVLWAVPVAALIYLGFFLFAPQETWNAAFVNEIELGSLKLTLASDHQPVRSALTAPVIASVLLLIAVGVLGIVICRMLRALLRPMKEGKPFEGSVSRGLNRLGWLVLIGGGISSVGVTVCNLLMTRATHALELLQSDAFTQITVSESFDLTFAVVAVVLFLLSFVFRYGEELQNLSDETL